MSDDQGTAPLDIIPPTELLGARFAIPKIEIPGTGDPDTLNLIPVKVSQTLADDCIFTRLTLTDPSRAYVLCNHNAKRRGLVVVNESNTGTAYILRRESDYWGSAGLGIPAGWGSRSIGTCAKLWVIAPNASQSSPVIVSVEDDRDA